MINHHVTVALAEQHRSELRGQAEHRRLAKQAESGRRRRARYGGPPWPSTRRVIWSAYILPIFHRAPTG
jgi:hypothetical protein